jgi:cytoskeletal protein RodZ
VSKAHCQVLLSYLDVNFPNWDANGKIASRNYFFPAIAEKFPQLVTREWRNKLKYPQGPKVSPELTQLGAPPPARKRRPAFRIGVVATLALIVLASGYWLWRHPEQRSAWRRRIWPFAAERVTSNEPLSTNETKPAPPESPKTKPVAEHPSAASPDGAKPPPESLPSTPGVPPADASAKPTAPELSQMAPPDPADLKPVAAPPSPATASKPWSASAKKEVVLTKPVEIRLAYGKVTLRPGAVLKIVSREGPFVKVSYLNNVISVPTTSTDLNREPSP